MVEINKREEEETTKDTIIGKSILIGLTWYDHQGGVTKQEQIFGVITKAIEESSIMEVDEPDGTYWPLPYFPSAIQVAHRGKYTCSSNGQIVENPELVMSWRVTETEGSELPDWEPNYLLYSEPVEPREWEYESYESVDDIEHSRRVVSTIGHKYIGKYLIVGLRYYEEDEKGARFIRQEQRYGRIVKVNPADGIVIRQENGDEYHMPPDLAMLECAPEGEYRLESTGVIVKNPDYVVEWAIHSPKRGK